MPLLAQQVHKILFTSKGTSSAGARVEGVCCAALPRLVDAAVALRAEVCAALVPLGFAGGGGAGVGSSLLSSSVRSRSSSIDSFCVSASAT